MSSSKIDTASENVHKRNEHAASLEHAFNVAGVGWYNIKYCMVLALFLISAIVEPLGYSYVLPAAKCDLKMTDAQRGFLSSVPFIGIVFSSFPWGYLVDTKGRKMTVICSSLVGGGLSIISAFMPDYSSFTVCKVFASLCIACPSSVPYTFIGEILPLKYRDVTLSIINAMQILGSVLVPLLAWAILPLDFSVDFGAYNFRPWRLLTIIYGSTFLISAMLLLCGPESPKFLLSQGRHDETLEILKMIYSKNTGKPCDEYPIKQLHIEGCVKKEKIRFFTSLKVQSAPLLRAPYLKWMSLNSFIFIGIFATLNGLYVWLPDVLNRVLTGDGEGLTACEVIAQRLNKTGSHVAICNDRIDTITYIINCIANVSCALIAIVVSSTVKIIGKKKLLTAVLTLVGVFCIMINIVTQDILFAIFLSAIPIIGLAIGPVNAYAVEIFPTHLRGMAVSLSMMIGRCGSIVGANVAGLLLNAACTATFYMFGGFLILCALSSFLLPNSKRDEVKTEIITRL